MQAGVETLSYRAALVRNLSYLSEDDNSFVECTAIFHEGIDESEAIATSIDQKIENEAKERLFLFIMEINDQHDSLLDEEDQKVYANIAGVTNENYVAWKNHTWESLSGLLTAMLYQNEIDEAHHDVIKSTIEKVFMVSLRNSDLQISLDNIKENIDVMLSESKRANIEGKLQEAEDFISKIEGDVGNNLKGIHDWVILLTSLKNLTELLDKRHIYRLVNLASDEEDMSKFSLINHAQNPGTTFCSKFSFLCQNVQKIKDRLAECGKKIHKLYSIQQDHILQLSQKMKEIDLEEKENTDLADGLYALHAMPILEASREFARVLLVNSISTSRKTNSDKVYRCFNEVMTTLRQSKEKSIPSNTKIKAFSKEKLNNFIDEEITSLFWDKFFSEKELSDFSYDTFCLQVLKSHPQESLRQMGQEVSDISEDLEGARKQYFYEKLFEKLHNSITSFQKFKTNALSSEKEREKVFKTLV